jgi:hypothetical protein
MIMDNEKYLAKRRMSAEDAAAILSQTLEDVAARRITLRHALAVSRVASALAKVIEITDLNARVEFLEEMLKKRRTTK